jgi:hypothetical protein
MLPAVFLAGPGNRARSGAAGQVLARSRRSFSDVRKSQVNRLCP